MRSLFRNVLIVIALGGGLSDAAPAIAQDDLSYAPVLAPETETDVAIARRLSRNGALVIDNQRLRNLDALRRFYAERGFDPVWTDTSGAVPAADGLVALLRAADQEGLNPLHYHADAIERRVGSADVTVQAELDLLIADAVMEYATDLRTGRLTPRSIAPELAAVPPRLDPVEIAKRGRDQAEPRRVPVRLHAAPSPVCGTPRRSPAVPVDRRRRRLAGGGAGAGAQARHAGRERAGVAPPACRDRRSYRQGSGVHGL